jgi:hypothetical protein
MHTDTGGQKQINLEKKGRVPRRRNLPSQAREKIEKCSRYCNSLRPIWQGRFCLRARSLVNAHLIDNHSFRYAFARREKMGVFLSADVADWRRFVGCLAALWQDSRRFFDWKRLSKSL